MKAENMEIMQDFIERFLKPSQIELGPFKDRVPSRLKKGTRRRGRLLNQGANSYIHTPLLDNHKQTWNLPGEVIKLNPANVTQPLISVLYTLSPETIYFNGEFFLIDYCRSFRGDDGAGKSKNYAYGEIFNVIKNDLKKGEYFSAETFEAWNKDLRALEILALSRPEDLEIHAKRFKKIDRALRGKLFPGL